MADYVQFLSENCLNRRQIFGRVGFSKTESELHFGFLHIPNIYMWIPRDIYAHIRYTHTSAFFS